MTNWNWLTVPGLALALSACTPAPVVAPADPVPPTTSAAASAVHDGTVTKVTDGDTVHVTGLSGAEETVRIVGIDTPETKDPRKPVQCGGPEATAFASVTLLGQHVHVVPDPTQDRVDRYGRTLAYIELIDANPTTKAPAGSDYSTLVAEAGWARAYIYDPRHPPQRITQIQAAESRASVMRRGIWSAMCEQSS